MYKDLDKQGTKIKQLVFVGLNQIKNTLKNLWRFMKIILMWYVIWSYHQSCCCWLIHCVLISRNPDLILALYINYLVLLLQRIKLFINKNCKIRYFATGDENQNKPIESRNTTAERLNEYFHNQKKAPKDSILSVKKK